MHDKVLNLTCFQKKKKKYMYSFRKSVLISLMCFSALILSKGITFSYVGLAEVVMRGRYTGLTLPNLNLGA